MVVVTCTDLIHSCTAWCFYRFGAHFFLFPVAMCVGRRV